MKKLSVKDRAMVANVMPVVPPSSSVSTFRKAQTGPGVMVAHLEKQSEVFRDNEKLREELQAFDESLMTKKLNPSHVSVSRWSNRHKDSFSGGEFQRLKDEIASAGGNIQPIKVRPIIGSSETRFEIVFGHRRHQACLELGLEVSALIESIDDKALFEQMDRENRQRADLRPYEQGEMYRRALKEGLYPSQRNLAESLDLQIGNVSTAIKVAELPAAVLDAFSSRLDVQYRWAKPLKEALKKDPDVVIARAKAIAQDRKTGAVISSADALGRLLGTKKVADRTVKVHGKVVATVKKTKGCLVFEFQKDVVSDEQAKKIEKLIAEALS